MPGVSYSHFRDTIFRYNLMNPYQKVDADPDQLTKLDLLALMETGWYDVNVTGLEDTVTFGKEKGCSFYFDNCHA